MPPTTILFALVCAFWLYYLVRPLFAPREEAVAGRDRLVEEKRGYLYALRDAELDHVAGKISDEHFAAARSRLEADVTRVMAAIDADRGGDAEARVAARLAEIRGKGDPS